MEHCHAFFIDSIYIGPAFTEQPCHGEVVVLYRPIENVESMLITRNQASILGNQEPFYRSILKLNCMVKGGLPVPILMIKFRPSLQQHPDNVPILSLHCL